MSNSNNESDDENNEEENVLEDYETNYFETDYSSKSNLTSTLLTTYSPNSITTTNFEDSSCSVVTKHNKDVNISNRNRSIVREFSREFPKISKPQPVIDTTVSSNLLFKQIECSECSLLKRKAYRASKTTKHLDKIKARKEKISRDTIILTYFSDIFEIPIPEQLYKKLCFHENLIISFEPGCQTIKNFGASDIQINDENNDKQLITEFSECIGSFSLRIEEYNQKFITYCKSQLEINDSIAGTNIISTVSDEICLNEEKKTEWYFEDMKKIEKNLHVVQENANYVAFLDHKDSSRKKVISRRGELNLQSKGEFIQDGGLYVLMRYLITTEFIGHLQFWTMDINGKIGICKMDVGERRNIIINNSIYKTIRIKKELTRANIKKEISKTYFLPTGYMILHRWNGCSYYIHVDDTLPIPNKYEYNLVNNWMNDIILLSQFEDEKCRITTNIKTYLNDHPQIKNLLHDYLFSLLLFKPENVLEYSINFFLNMFRDYQIKSDEENI